MGRERIEYHMPIIIDGHNLIPKIPGLSLHDADDELHLIELLQVYCQHSRKQVEVFFDNASPGQPAARSFGLVKARFIREGRSADQAIQDKLTKLGRSARNWTVVSSDRQVLAAARAAHARVLTAEEFWREMQTSSRAASSDEKPPNEVYPEDLDEWLRLFGEGGE